MWLLKFYFYVTGVSALITKSKAAIGLEVSAASGGYLVRERSRHSGRCRRGFARTILPANRENPILPEPALQLYIHRPPQPLWLTLGSYSAAEATKALGSDNITGFKCRYTKRYHT